jgi:hypothetical protein
VQYRTHLKKKTKIDNSALEIGKQIKQADVSERKGILYLAGLELMIKS